MRHRHSVTEDPVKLVGLAAIAAAIGATVAMLFTPRSGQQIRRGLGRRAHHLKDEMHDHFEVVSDDASETAQDAKKRLQAAASQVANDTKTTATRVKRDTKATATRAKSAAKTASKPRTPRS